MTSMIMSLPILLFISISILPTLSTPLPSIPLSYTFLCSSTLPPSIPTTSAYVHNLPSFSTDHFSGGHHRFFALPLDNTSFYTTNSLLNLRIRPNCHETITPGVYIVRASLSVSSPYVATTYGGSSYRQRSLPETVEFSLTGFWSNITGTACMVGSVGLNSMNFSGVLKLKYPREANPSIRTSVASGTLESTASSKNDPAYFDTISMFHFPTLWDYDYGLVLNEIEGSGGSKFSDSPISSQLCNGPWRWGYFDMEYGAECEEAKKCSPLGNNSLPNFLYLHSIQCSDRRIRYIAKFQRPVHSIHESFSSESTLIAEGSWDNKNRRLLIAACQILNPIDHFGNPVGDCHIRMSLWHPLVWTIQDVSGLSGLLWSEKSNHDDDNAHFRTINITTENWIGVGAKIQGLRYEYTEMERVPKSCLVKNPTKMQRTYPDAKSSNMRFDAKVLNLKGERCGWGYAMPLSVGSEMFQDDIVTSTLPIELGYNSSVRASVSKISYKISITPYWQQVNSSTERNSSIDMSMDRHGKVEIIAEGFYDVETGKLCMVGCRKLGHLSNTSSDCEIVMEFEFPSLDAKNRDRINGTIVSTRTKGDPLHFKELTLLATAFYTETAKQTVSQIDFENVFKLIYCMLLGIFLWAQILYVKRNPKITSSISLTMVLILILSYMFLFSLSFMDILAGTDKHGATLPTKGRWHEASEMACNVMDVVALFLQIRLLQLVWTGKQNDKSSWGAERMSSFVTLAIYVVGALVAHLIRRVTGKESIIWDGMKCYPCLIISTSLLPQIVHNAVMGSTEKALSRAFYIGTTATQLMPYVYYRYLTFYADSAGEFQYMAWYHALAFGQFAMALVIYLQQRYGGRCIVPRRFWVV